MNPHLMVRADLKSMRGSAFAVIVLIAIAVAIGVALAAQERALRHSSAMASTDFDLLIGAPGSQTQLVMTSVYLQTEALPLINGSVLQQLASDSRVADFAPIAFGDVVSGYPVVGTTLAFVSRWNKIAAPEEGRFFTAETEAIIGHDVNLTVGESLSPSHAIAGDFDHPGQASKSEAGHRHEHVSLMIVGRLPATGSPWDRAILIPIESVWKTHGLGTGHSENGRIGLPFDANVPPVPAIVVKPRTVPDAYALRGAYRQGGTMAVFPAEVLVGLYRNLGDVKDVLIVASTLNTFLIFGAVTLIMLTLFSTRRRRYGILRALGATRLYIVLVVWLDALVLIAIGCIVGLLFGWGLTGLVSAFFSQQTGLQLQQSLTWSDISSVLMLLVGGSAISTLPALAAYRIPISESIK